MLSTRLGYLRPACSARARAAFFCAELNGRDFSAGCLRFHGGSLPSPIDFDDMRQSYAIPPDQKYQKSCTSVLETSEVVPCIRQVKPEIAELLQTLIKTCQSRTRVRPDLLDEQNVVDKVEETCQFYWKSVLHQLESSGPVGECRMLAK